MIVPGPNNCSARLPGRNCNASIAAWVTGPTVTPTSKTIKPFKFHKTLRFNEEVMWANEDRQLEVVDEILALIQPSLSRALDFGVFHEINPTGGAVVAAMNGGLTDTTNLVEYVAADKPYVSLDAADALVLAHRVGTKLKHVTKHCNLSSDSIYLRKCFKSMFSCFW